MSPTTLPVSSCFTVFVSSATSKTFAKLHRKRPKTIYIQWIYESYIIFTVIQLDPLPNIGRLFTCTDKTQHTTNNQSLPGHHCISPSSTSLPSLPYHNCVHQSPSHRTSHQPFSTKTPPSILEQEWWLTVNLCLSKFLPITPIESAIQKPNISKQQQAPRSFPPRPSK